MGTFRKLFDGVLALCREAGLVSVGVIAIDGTKIKASASMDQNRDYRELVGQIADTLSGDAQRNFRHQYSIEVHSQVHDGDAPVVYPPHARPIVIPIAWRSYQARLVVCLDG